MNDLMERSPDLVLSPDIENPPLLANDDKTENKKIMNSLVTMPLIENSNDKKDEEGDGSEKRLEGDIKKNEEIKENEENERKPISFKKNDEILENEENVKNEENKENAKIEENITKIKKTEKSEETAKNDENQKNDETPKNLENPKNNEIITNNEETLKMKENLEEKEITDEKENIEEKENIDEIENIENTDRSPIYLKILFNYIQILSILGNFPFNWPEELVNLFSDNKQAVSSSQSFFSIDCFLKQDVFSKVGLRVFFTKLMLYALSPIGFILIAFIVWLMVYFVKYGRYMKQHIREYKACVITSIVILLFMIHPNIIQADFEAFSYFSL